MERRLIRLVAGSAAGGGAMIALAALAAPAAYAYGPLQPSLYANVNSASAVRTASVDITGAQPSETYTFTVTGNGQTLNEPGGAADSNGDFAGSFDISSLAPGTYEVQAVGSDGDIITSSIAIPASTSATNSNNGESASEAVTPSHTSASGGGPAAGSGAGPAAGPGAPTGGGGTPASGAPAAGPTVGGNGASSAPPKPAGSLMSPAHPVTPVGKPTSSSNPAAPAPRVLSGGDINATLFQQGTSPSIGVPNIRAATHSILVVASAASPAFSSGDITAATAGGAGLIAVGGLVLLSSRRRRAWS